MKLENHTPFPSLCFEHIDAQGRQFHVVVLRQTLQWDHAAKLRFATQQEALCLSDEFFGLPNQSSMRRESDLCPYKPKCDVIVHADAYAPRGHLASRVAVRVSLKPAVKANQDKATLIDKVLIVTGAREFYQTSWRSMLGVGVWQLSEPQPFLRQPIRYEYAFGGQCRVNQDSAAAKRVPAKQRLTKEQLAQHPDAGAAPAVVAHTHYACNPLGRGYLEKWYQQATGVKRIAAPQIEVPQHPFTAEVFCRALDGDVGREHLVAGLGIVGRSWQQRLPLAGTYDAAWLAQQHPLPPYDFSYAHWNGAPADMQTPHLRGDETLEVVNLCAGDMLGAQRDSKGNTVLRLTLPAHVLMGWAWMQDGQLRFAAPLLDTLSLDLLSDPPTLSLVHRLSLPKDGLVEKLELRMMMAEDVQHLLRQPAPNTQVQA